MANELHNSTVPSLLLNTFAMSNQRLEKAIFKRKAQLLTNQSFVGSVVRIAGKPGMKKKKTKLKSSYMTLLN